MIFKIKLYAHHFLSIILFVLIELIIDLYFKNLSNDIKEERSLFFYEIYKRNFFLHNVVAKYVIEKKYVTAYEMSFYNGIINLVLFAIFAVLDFYFFKLNKYEGYFYNFSNKDYFGIFGIMFSQFFPNLSLFFTIKNNSPNYAFIIYIFGQFVFLNFSVNSIFIIIYLLIILFLSLIFTEIIEINFCRLSKIQKEA